MCRVGPKWVLRAEDGTEVLSFVVRTSGRTLDEMLTPLTVEVTHVDRVDLERLDAAVECTALVEVVR